MSEPGGESALPPELRRTDILPPVSGVSAANLTDATGRGEKAQVVRDSTWNFSAAMLTALCSGVRVLLLPKLLPTVDAYGIMNFLNLFKTYSPYVNAGVLMGYGVEVPHRRGRGDNSTTTALEHTAYTFSTLATIVFATGMVFLAQFVHQAEVQAGLLVFAVVVVLQNLLQFYAVRLRVEMNFRLRSQQEAVNSLAFTALAIGLAAWWGLYAVFAGLLFGELLALWWTRRHDRYRPLWRIDLPALRTLVRLGIPVTIMTLLGTFIFDVDLILIKLWFPGFREIGLYGLGVTFSSLMMMVPYTVGHALAPRIMQETGKPAAARDLMRYLRKPVLLLTALAALGSGFAFLLFPYLVEYYLPHYRDGLPAMRVLVWYTVFMAAVTTLGFVIAGFKRFTRIICLQLLVIAVNLAANVFLLLRGGGITGIAAVTTFSYALYALLGLLEMLRLSMATPAARAEILLAVFGGAGYAAAAALLAETLAGFLAPPWSLLSLPLFILLLVPPTYLFERRFGLLSELHQLAAGMLPRRKLL